MCGIAGFAAKGKLLPSSLLEKMTTTLAHRGPDDEGFIGIRLGDVEHWKKSGAHNGDIQIGLGFRRLAILDLSPSGAQPMESQNRRYWLTANGEIYNYVELREKLSNVSLKSTGDMQVLLELISQKGLSALSECNGIFAFALYDREYRELTLVRDPLGVKPLYYAVTKDGIFYASELRALLAAGVESQLNTPLLSRYLASGWVPEPDTLFKNIYKLEPGHLLKISASGEVKKECYWQLNFRPDEKPDFNDWTDEADQILHASITRQLRSDVPVGFFLSGGIDSSLLAVKALQVRDEKPSTFTVGFKWAANKEDRLDLESARYLAQKFPFQHNELILEPEIVNTLPKVIRTLEEPMMDPAAICSYLICEAAKDRFKVLISGQGGDELFGGYPVYQGGWAAAGFNQIPSPFRKLASSAAQMLPYSIDGKPIQAVHKLQKFLNSSKSQWPEPFFLLRSTMSEDLANELLVSQVQSQQEYAFATHAMHFDKAESLDWLHQMMYVDIKTYLTSTNLAYSDKTSCAHSVELRVPLLDMELVDLVSRLPGRYKIAMNESKLLLKKIASRYLPKQIIERKKTGFGLPMREWLRNELQPMARELLSESHLRDQGLFDPKLPSQWLDEHKNAMADHTAKLYSLITFQIWAHEFGVRS